VNALLVLALFVAACSDDDLSGSSESSSEASSEAASGTEVESDTGDTESSGSDEESGEESGTPHPCEDGVDEPNEICLEVRDELGSAGPANTIYLGELDNSPGLDVALGSLSVTSATLHFGDGNEGFEEALDVPLSAGIRDLHGDDFNGDGIPDLALVSLTAGAFGVSYAQEAGVFGPPGLLPAGDMARNMAAADLDGDDDLDAVVASETESRLRVFRNENGMFVADEPLDTGIDPYEIQIADLNADERPDLIVAAREQGAVSVHLQLEDESFGSGVHYPIGAGPRSLALADLNDDGFLDVVTANYDEDQVGVMFGDGAGAFQDPVGFSVGSRPIALRIGDLDDDGDFDVVTALFGQGQVAVLVGNSAGLFDEMRTFAVSPQPISLELGHLDDDGRLDVVVASFQGPASVLVHLP
jgi:hypothetical protein